MDVLDIGEVTERTGVAVSTLRYYEERGLIESVGRRGLRRQFSADVVDRLALIALGRAAGFSLEEIGGYFGGRDHTTVMHAIRTIAADRAADPQFAGQLERIEAGLAPAAAQSA